MVAQWQERWETCETGRELYMYFPDVEVRLKHRWVQPDYVTLQMLTGHGCFNDRLRKLSLRENGTCYCGHTEKTREHILWDCQLYEAERLEMLDRLERTLCGPVFHGDLISSERNFKLFCLRHGKRKVMG